MLEVDGQAWTDWLFEESLLDADHCVAVALNRREVHVGRDFEVLPGVKSVLSELAELRSDLTEEEEWAIAKKMDPVKPTI